MRLKVIYGPDGRAGEYARDGLAANLYKGCPHGCVYCSVPGTLRMDREEFHKCATPKDDVLAKFESDCHTLIKRGITSGKIFMSFACDPYCPEEKKYGITRGAIEIAHENGFGVDILTKGGKLAKRDFDLLGEKDSFGVTLTSWDPTLWEPNAARPEERRENLRQAHERGISTWVSLEPVIYPSSVPGIICETCAYTDLYKIGKLNHHSFAKAIDWKQFAKDVVEVLDQHGCKYYLKDDLRKYLPEGGKA